MGISNDTMQWMGEKGLKMKFKMSWLQLKSLFHCQHARKRSIVFSRISLHGCFQHKKSKVRSLYHFCFDSVVTLMPRYSPNQRHQTVLNKKKPFWFHYKISFKERFIHFSKTFERVITVGEWNNTIKVGEWITKYGNQIPHSADHSDHPQAC